MNRGSIDTSGVLTTKYYLLSPTHPAWRKWLRQNKLESVQNIQQSSKVFLCILLIIGHVFGLILALPKLLLSDKSLSLIIRPEKVGT